MSKNLLADKAQFDQWLMNKLKPEEVTKELLASGFNTDAVLANLKEYKRLKQNKRNFAGFVYMGVGAFIGFVSCVLAILNPIPEWHNFFLFGLTTVAVLIVFIGLYMVFE